MPMKLLPLWITSYGDKLNKYYDDFKNDQSILIETFWQDWVDSNAQGIETGPPFVGGSGTTSKTSFSPVVFPNPGTAPVAALVLANAWQSWYNAITWSTPPPIPPFSVINSVTASPIGAPLAYATLLAGLIAEMAIIPPDPNTAMLIKATAYATLFNTATLAAGVQISGLAIAGSPPPPLVIPFSPVL